VGLLEELNYTVTPPNRVQHTLQRAAAGERIGRVLQRSLYSLDKAVYGVTADRHTATSLLAGLPIIMLTTTGARTGNDRTMPLVGIPAAEDLFVIGSNFGTPSTPGWVHNLEANPAAVVSFRDRRVPVVARHADQTETDRVFEAASTVFAGFPRYRRLAANREIRVFALESAPRRSGPARCCG
jgi:deazaflavin-dependent oxidoreductase (nitroreductase family)